MRWNRTVLAGMVLAGVTALFFIGGCTNASTRADLTVVSVNGGATYYSDLVNEVDSAHIFIPIDQVVVRFGNHPHDGNAPLDPGSGFSEIVVNHYENLQNQSIVIEGFVDQGELHVAFKGVLDLVDPAQTLVFLPKGQEPSAAELNLLDDMNAKIRKLGGNPEVVAAEPEQVKP